jgi:hypothetical protein
VFGLAVVLFVGAVVASGTGSAGFQPVGLAAAKAGGTVAQSSVGTVTVTDSGDWSLDEGPGGGIESAHVDVHYRASETIRIPACAVTAPGTTGCLAKAADHSFPPSDVVGTPTVTASGSTSSVLAPLAEGASNDLIPCDGSVQALPVSIGPNSNPFSPFATVLNAPIQVHFALHEMWVYVAPPWVRESAATPAGVTPGAACPPLGGHSLLQVRYAPVTDLDKILPKTFTYQPPDPQASGEAGSDTITVTGSATPCSVSPERSAAAASASAGTSTTVDAYAAEACPHVALRVSPSTTTLDHLVGLQATLTPTVPPGTVYDWQIKRADASRWTTFASLHGNRLKFDARVAGKFLVRVVAESPGVAGDIEVSDPKSLLVQFPDADEIKADSSVKSATDAAWREMQSLVTKTTVQEVGFWIKLDSCTGRYGFTPQPPKRGKPFAPTAKGIGVDLGPRPPDDPPSPPVTGCAMYYVASFHTHTAETFAPKTDLRVVGPSDADNTVALDPQVLAPGLVYDYVPEKGCAAFQQEKKPCISGGWPKNDRAIIYITKRIDRRPVSTTPESH